MKNSFSSPHVLAYTIVAMLQLNLNHHYNPLYWQTAVLNSNSGSIEVDEEAKKQSKDYGKMAKAVSELQQSGVQVASPLINTAEFSFTPDTEKNQIIFSLKAIRGLNDETANEILSKRPFKSFEDFLERVDPKIIKTGHVVNLIKAGAFQEFEPNTAQLMAKYILSISDQKEKLNGQNMPTVVKSGLLNTNPEWKKYAELFETRKKINSRVHKKLTNPNNTLLKATNNEINLLTNQLGSGMIHSYDNQFVIVDKKILDKQYNDYMKPFYEDVLNDPEFLNKFNQSLFLEEWMKRTKGGGVVKWTMDALTYYPEGHELEGVDTKKYNIANYTKLDPNPEPIGFTKWRGREYPQYPLHTIAGTVIDKDNTKHTVTLLTIDGVATCKFYAGTYAFYNKEIKVNGKLIEESWFKRGNLIMISGFRRGDQFVNKKIKGQEHSVALITDVEKGGEVSLQSERYYVQ